ncbi:hypothetical protein JTB14_001855 [Gonioctena quinquepunctata]|nr:hypothetical protein JTB14_001855 [Gonioctena quinquepunctata]
MQRVGRIEDHINTKSNRKRILISILILHTITITDMLYDLCVFDDIQDHWDMAYFMSVENLYFLYMQVSLNAFIEHIRMKFKSLNKLLEREMLALEKNKSVDFVVEYYAIKKIKRIKRFHKDLTNLVDDIDGLYGWPILLVAFHILISSLSILNGFILHGGTFWGELFDLVNVTVSTNNVLPSYE